ncbi:pyrroline-5-carboxylate reductase [Aminobacterium sp. EBM-42]|uniref:pyrroline-5-carboxylate reductase n=1 Tax=Aminobacterium sp. EBM-42 TaxID=1918503 RepID=UPI000A4D4DE0|nr:pyrroline-5-carboxylate reductase [Aminobacterium sp. EBM-42]NLK29634.1 pyrroline-5-carboxylate reductase [Aminobacterium colombiense]
MVNKKRCTIAVIGAGMLGSSVARGWVKENCTVIAYDKDRQKVESLEELGICYEESNEAIARADVVVFALKPHIQLPVVASLAQNLTNKLCFSMAAGIRLEQLAEAAPHARWIRGMTNICAAVNAAFTAYTPSENVTEEDMKKTKLLFGLLGEREETAEPNLDAITGISGSGPAYMFTVLEALTYGGLRVGIPKDLALKASAATMIGAAKLVLETGKHPAELKDGVVTPGGTTIEGLYELEEGAVRASFIRAIAEATRRGKELGEQKTNKKK